MGREGIHRGDERYPARCAVTIGVSTQRGTSVPPLAEAIIAKAGHAAEIYHRLVLLVGPSGTGKTAALQAVRDRLGVPLINVNLDLARRMLDLTERQRRLRLARLLDEIVGEHPLVLFDNTEMLFDVSLAADPLRLLHGLSRNRTVVATWNGTVANGWLTYATPDHPEHRRYPSRELLVVTAQGVGQAQAAQAR